MRRALTPSQVVLHDQSSDSFYPIICLQSTHTHTYRHTQHMHKCTQTDTNTHSLTHTLSPSSLLSASVLPALFHTHTLISHYPIPPPPPPRCPPCRFSLSVHDTPSHSLCSISHTTHTPPHAHVSLRPVSPPPPPPPLPLSPPPPLSLSLSLSISP